MKSFLALALGLSLGAAAAAAAQPASDIFLLDLSEHHGRVETAGTPTAATDRDGYDNQPAFTRDGGGFLYTSIRDGQADIYHYDRATGESRRITRTPESEYSPTPMPGSDRFSVVRVEADGTQRLWSFGPDGSDPRLLLERVAPVGYHAWVGSDRLALFILGDPPTLQVARLDQGTAHTAVEGIGRSIHRVPHHNMVTFTQQVDGEWWLRELNLSNGLQASIARLPAPDGDHAWTPGGTILTTAGTRIYQLGADGAWQVIADLSPYDMGPLSRLAVSADGSVLAVVADRL